MVDEVKGWRGLWRMDVILLGIAATAGITGAVFANRYLGASAAATEAELRSRYESSAVVVAATDLASDQPLDTSGLAVRRMPKEFLPPDAVTADRAGELIGQRTAIPISRGSLVVPAALSRPQPPRLAEVLEGPRRALTIMVDQVNSQAGNLMPGDWVDLYYSRTEGGGAVLVPLLQRVEVLAAGADLRIDGGPAAEPREERHFSSITLGLSGTDAARVLLAQQSGTLSVVLRSAGDQSQLPSIPRDSRELLLPPAQPPRSPGQGSIELLVGGHGGLAPERSWLRVGQRHSSLTGEAS